MAILIETIGNSYENDILELKSERVHKILDGTLKLRFKILDTDDKKITFTRYVLGVYNDTIHVDFRENEEFEMNFNFNQIFKGDFINYNSADIKIIASNSENEHQEFEIGIYKDHFEKPFGFENVNGKWFLKRERNDNYSEELIIQPYYTIGDQTIKIEGILEETFMNMNITNIYIPHTIETIRTDAFKGVYGLTIFYAGRKPFRINKNAFEDNTIIKVPDITRYNLDKLENDYIFEEFAI